MVKLIKILFLIIVIVLVACGKPPVPVPPPTEMLLTIRPNEKPRPTQIPSSSFVPESAIALKPTSVITLTTVEVTETISTRNRAVLVWSIEGKRYFGIADFNEALLTQLRPTIKDFEPSAIPEIIWSPGGTQFMYRTPGLYNFDISVFNVDESADVYYIDVGAPAAFCEWAPLDGRYLVCFDYCMHAPYSRTIIDTRQWRTICRDLGSFACGLSGSEFCPSPSLADGTPWVTIGKSPNIVHTPSPMPTKDSFDKKVNALVGKFCQNFEREGGCQQSIVNPNKHFVAVISNHNLFALDTEQEQTWYLGNEPKQLSWSADARYLAWITSNQVRVFDVTTHTIIAYALPDVTLLSVEWSPLH